MRKKKTDKKITRKKISGKKVTGKKITGKKIIGNKISDNQFEAMGEWLAYYGEHRKLPYNRVICSSCKVLYASLKGIAMSHAMKRCGGDIKRVLAEAVCKDCKDVHPKEDKPKTIVFLSREEMEAQKDAVRATLPKFRVYEPNVIDLTKDKEMCKKYTYFSCHRPDIYLDYGCDECAIKKNCACPLKDINRIADGRGRKKSKKSS
jgi:hypothetical protein